MGMAMASRAAVESDRRRAFLGGCETYGQREEHRCQHFDQQLGKYDVGRVEEPVQQRHRETSHRQKEYPRKASGQQNEPGDRQELNDQHEASPETPRVIKKAAEVFDRAAATRSGRTPLAIRNRRSVTSPRARGSSGRPEPVTRPGSARTATGPLSATGPGGKPRPARRRNRNQPAVNIPAVSSKGVVIPCQSASCGASMAQPSSAQLTGSRNHRSTHCAPIPAARLSAARIAGANKKPNPGECALAASSLRGEPANVPKKKRAV